MEYIWLHRITLYFRPCLLRPHFNISSVFCQILSVSFRPSSFFQRASGNRTYSTPVNCFCGPHFPKENVWCCKIVKHTHVNWPSLNKSRLKQTKKKPSLIAISTLTFTVEMENTCLCESVQLVMTRSFFPSLGVCQLTSSHFFLFFVFRAWSWHHFAISIATCHTCHAHIRLLLLRSHSMIVFSEYCHTQIFFPSENMVAFQKFLSLKLE